MVYDIRIARIFLIFCIVASSIDVGVALGNLGVNLGRPASFWATILVVNAASLICGLLWLAYILWKSDAPRS